MTDAIRVFAPAKVNLGLTVHGRRTDGYHELSSLVAFADVGDVLVLERSDKFSLAVAGPMAARIDGPNLIARCAEHLLIEAARLRPGRVSLHKTLPVGAGLGGGSSDVAAYLRAVRRANPDVSDVINWGKIARSLGADVPVCLVGRVTWVHGIGERFSAADARIPRMSAVLVNPGIAISTGDVFRQLGAGPVPHECEPAPPFVDGIDALATLSNDLEVPALLIAPQISAARDALEATADVRLVRMSGSGATFFGIYDDPPSAENACDAIRNQHPDWWIETTTLGDAPTGAELLQDNSAWQER